ncbi:MAG: lamin tail domain-containing protein [Candidatus Cloacimonadota bacterium]|nr:lamin tail domain-containing protein [Candidatus Cloacimonadota bacterium]
MKKFIILIALTFVFCVLYSDLFFSEYIEGSSNNKALEIYNPNEETVDLSNYFIKSNYNGNDWTDDVYEFPAGSTLAAGEVWVVANEAADPVILNVADETLAYNEGGYVASFNGNDARGLFKMEGGNEVLLDIIGIPGEDPGTGWDAAGVTAATFDHTMVRKPSVLSGTTEWSSAAGTNEDNSQWIVYDQDTFNYLGYHEIEGEDTTPPTLINAEAESETIVKLNFSEAVEETSAENIANYSISNLSIDLIELLPSNSTVRITTSPQTEGEVYTITVNNVEDLAGNVIEPNSTIEFAGFVPFQYDQIADIQNNLQDYMGEDVTVTGVVTIGDGLLQTGRTKFYIQDGSGRGIQIYNYSMLPVTYVRGDSIEVTGTVDKYNDDVEITSPQITLLSQNAALPEPHNVTGNEDVTLNGTWAEATGVVVDNWDSEYGFAQITIDIGDNVEIPLMFWDTTGADVSEYVIGNEVIANGIIAFYEGDIQITCGYEEDIRIDATLPVIKNFSYTSDAMEEICQGGVRQMGWKSLCPGQW